MTKDNKVLVLDSVRAAKEEKKDERTFVVQGEFESEMHISESEGFAHGQALERERCKAIYNSPEAKGREELAKHLMFKTGFSPEKAIAFLKISPSSSPQSEMSPLEKAMCQTDQPGINSLLNE